MEPTVSVDFEVFGKVQGKFHIKILNRKHNFNKISGVYFPKYCKEMCEQLSISGWVKNTKKGTIFGKLQGQRSNIEHM